MKLQYLHFSHSAHTHTPCVISSPEIDVNLRSEQAIKSFFCYPPSLSDKLQFHLWLFVFPVSCPGSCTNVYLTPKAPQCPTAALITLQNDLQHRPVSPSLHDSWQKKKSSGTKGGWDRCEEKNRPLFSVPPLLCSQNALHVSRNGTVTSFMSATANSCPSHLMWAFAQLPWKRL